MRKPMASLVLRVALAGAVGLCCQSPAMGADRIVLSRHDLKLQVTAPQLFAIAGAALAKGDLGTARRAYQALMDDPSADIRLEARFRLAMLERRNGNLRRAATLLRQIVDERPGATRARLELAETLDQLGDSDAAWRELRAVQAGGLPLDVARLVDRYSEAVRARRPFGASFGVAIAPDSNINRATRLDTLGTVFGDFDISKDAKAKSGVGLTLTGQTYRRLAMSNDASLLVRLSGLANLYRQTGFDEVAADLAVGPELTFNSTRLHVELGGTQRWFGGKPFMRSVRLATMASRPIGRRTLLRLSGAAALVDNQLNDQQDGRLYSGGIAAEHAMSSTAGIAASLAIDRQSLNDPGYSTIGWRGTLTAWHELKRSTVTAELELGSLHADDRLLLFPNRRSDEYRRLSLAVTLRQLQWHGFAPVARLTLERNASSIAFYDYRRSRTELGFERAF